MLFWTRYSPKKEVSLRSVRSRFDELETRLAPAVVPLLVTALHEFGHSLGLDHDNTGAYSIMDPIIHSEYDVNYFTSGQDPAVGLLRAKYANPDVNGPWNDGVANGKSVVSYSYMKDGAK